MRRRSGIRSPRSPRRLRVRFPPRSQPSAAWRRPPPSASTRPRGVASAARGLEPMSVSRCCKRWPSRDSTVVSRIRDFVNHQKRSRPRSLCGSGLCREPTERIDLGSRGKLLLRSEIRYCRRRRRYSCLSDMSVGFAVARAVRLEDVRLESARQSGNERFLEWAGGDDDLLGGDPPAVDLQREPPVLSGEPPQRAIQLDRQLERLRIPLQIRDHLVTVGVALWIAGERKAG